jgi:tripartite-type tricarboxylate transporter receptor subunit TctC
LKNGTSETRVALAPDIPTFAEMGLPRMSASSWVGLFALRGTPKYIIGRLNAPVVEALADLAVQSRFGDFTGEILPRERQTPEALGALQKAYAEKWWPIIKALG